MSRLDTPADIAKDRQEAVRRQSCQDYVNGSASFIGQQSALGVGFAVVAVATAGIGAAISNSDDGGVWKENRKTFLLSTAAVSTLLSYNFLDNAKSAATSASQASIALASSNEGEMWAGCQHARATYFDGRAASVGATRDVMKENRTREPETERADADAAATNDIPATQDQVPAKQEEPKPVNAPPPQDQKKVKKP